MVWAVAHLKSRCQVQPLSLIGVCRHKSASTACTTIRSFCRHVSGLGAAVKCSIRRRYSQSDGVRSSRVYRLPPTISGKTRHAADAPTQ